MTIQEARDILIHHNKWRRGVDGYEMLDPKDYGEAIDVAIVELGKLIEKKRG